MALWEIPASELMTQRLYRVRYRGEDQRGSVRLTVWLTAPSRYRMEMSDTLGRLHWSLQLDGDEALMVEHRNERFCSLDASRGAPRIAGLELPLDRIPALLLGRLPVEPVGSVHEEDGEWTLVDAVGRRWKAWIGEARDLEAWTLAEVGSQAEVSWHRERRGGILDLPAERRTVEWREVIRERMRVPPPVQAPPAGFHQEWNCEALAFP